MSQNYVLSFDMLCDTILEVDENIQSISVINRKGRAVEKKTKNGAELVQNQKNEMLLMQCALTMSMGKDFDEDFGEVGYILVQRKNFSMISLPLDEHIVFVTSNAPVDATSLVRKITVAIKRYKLEREKVRHQQSVRTTSRFSKEKSDLPELDPQPNLILVQ